MQGRDDEVDQLDADEEHQDFRRAHRRASCAATGSRGAQRDVGDATQSQRDQRDDDERVEDDR